MLTDESTKTTITVEFPIDDNLMEVGTQYLFEIVKQQIASAMKIDPEEVWIKQISAITNYDMGKEVTGEA
tara:strand:- start:867 stop:1076 length:210 start_codon:yes stop_codon:yes gene_type:complete